MARPLLTGVGPDSGGLTDCETAVMEMSMTYKYPTFGTLIYASYSGLQALAFALQKGLQKYDRGCYAFREGVIKKYRAGEMRIGDLYENNIMHCIANAAAKGLAPL